MRHRDRTWSRGLQHRLVLGCALLVLLAALAGHADTVARWVAVTPESGPPPVQTGDSHSYYDAVSNRLIVYIPGNPALSPSFSNQVWILENANSLGSERPRWSKLQTSGSVPTINVWPVVDYDRTRNQLVVYGGGGGNTSPALSDVFVLSHANGLGGTPTWTRITVSNPQPRVHHVGFYDFTTDSLVSFGGSLAFFGTTQGDLRRLSDASGTAWPSTWSTLIQAGDLPGPTEGATLVAHPSSSLAVLFGGHNATGPNAPVKNEARILRNATGLFGTPTWSSVPAPGALIGRTGHVAVIDPDVDRMIIQGGATFDTQRVAGTR